MVPAEKSFDFHCHLEQSPNQLVLVAIKTQDGTQYETSIPEGAVAETTRNAFGKLVGLQRFIDAVLHKNAKDGSFKLAYGPDSKTSGQPLIITCTKLDEYEGPTEFSLTLRTAPPSLNRVIAEMATLKKRLEKLEGSHSATQLQSPSDGAALDAIRGDMKYFESVLTRLSGLDALAAQPKATRQAISTVQLTAQSGQNNQPIVWQVAPLFQDAMYGQRSQKNDSVTLPQGTYFIIGACCISSNAQNQPLSLYVDTFVITSYFSYDGSHSYKTTTCTWTGALSRPAVVYMTPQFNNSFISATLSILKLS